MTRIEMIAHNGNATVQVKGKVITVTREDYAHDSKRTPRERDDAIIRAAQYKLNYGDV